jgi:uncharacterized membrane protein YgcG
MNTLRRKIASLIRPILFANLIVIAGTVRSATVVTENPVWPRPVIVPVPELTAGVTQTVAVLRSWKTISNPQGEFWSETNDFSNWRTLTVGGGRGGFGGGGFGGGGASQSAFQTTLDIPADYAGHRVVLRFDGVSNGSKIWVNGKFVRDHWGSLMPFTCDITDFVEPGKTASLVVGVDDSRTGLAQYVRAGGLQRDVKLFAEPADYISRFHIATDFDAQYNNSILKVWLRMDFHGEENGRIKLSLKNAQGQVVELKPDVIELSRATPETITDVPVASPLKWDAEHPNLYTLEVSVIGADGSVLQTLSRKFGFEKIERVGRDVLVNGKEVKLRGLWGGNSIQDMVDNNINHTRQKWVTEEMLADCDRLGVYVTDENPVDFSKNPVASDPQFLSQYMSFMADLVERDRDHPSVIMWGLDNESDYGSNVEPTFKYVRAEDPQRLSQFSWASHVPVNKELPYDVYSFHYPPFDGDLASYGNSAFNSHSLVLDRQPQPEIPVIADEYAHLPIYNPDELRRDPNVHNFWGESIKFYWEKMFATDGALGGDIFGLPGARGALPPEYWLIKKAYSPVRVDNQTLTNPGAGKPLSIAVKNWFDHTDLSELKIHWSVGNESGDVAGPAVAPHADGQMAIPARNWRDGDVVSLKFQRADGLVVQESALPVSPVLPALPTPQGPAPQITEDTNAITVAGKDFSLVFSKQTGLITGGIFQGTEIIESGPYLHIVATDEGKSTVDLPPWSLKQISTSRGANETVVSIAGNYGATEVSFELRVDGTGLITTKYKLGAFPFTPPAAHPHPWNNSHYGGFSEVGISFVLTNGVDRLAWNRKALWSFYPEDHVGRSTGLAQRAVTNGSWAQGGGSGGRGGRGGGGGGGAPQAGGGNASNDFRGMKEYIYAATALVGGTDLGLEALSDAHDAVRMDVSAVQTNGGVSMIVNNEWNYPQLGNSNFMKPPVKVGEGYANTVRVRFARNDVAP